MNQYKWGQDAKAYQAGIACGSQGVEREKNPYTNPKHRAAWDAGWQKGKESCK